MWSAWTESLKKRISRYLLQRYLGQYLQEKLTLEQLTIDLYKGTGNVTNISLDCQALNALAEQQNIPIEFIDGHVDNISVAIPWSSLMYESSEIEVSGLQVTIQPKRRIDTGSSMLESMWTSMASSMQLAEECMSTGDPEEEFPNQEEKDNLSGLDACAQAIDAVLSRVKICFRDSVIRVERTQKGCDTGIALEFHIKLWRYLDEACDERRDDNQPYETAYSYKKISLESMQCYSDIFCPRLYNYGAKESELQDGNTVLLAKFSGRHEIKLKIKQNESISGPQITADCNFGSLIAFMSPMQAHLVLKLFNELLNPESCVSLDDLSGRRCKEKPMDSFDFRRVEEELQEQLKPGTIGVPGLQQQQGWSSAGFDESDDEFLPMKNTKQEMFTSMTSTFMNASVTSVGSSMNQSVTESLFSTRLSGKGPYYQSPSTLPIVSSALYPSSIADEKTKFQLSFVSVTVVLLHEDVMSMSATTAVIQQTVDDMRKISGNFFRHLGLFGANITGKSDIDAVRQKLEGACQLSHHRLIGAPVKVDGLSSSNGNTTLTNGHVSIGYCELTECLASKDSMGTVNKDKPLDCIEVLTFPRNLEQGINQSCKIEFKHKSCKGQRRVCSKSTIKIKLQECSAEVDMSVIDRVNSLLHPQLLHYTESKTDQLKMQMDCLSGQNQTRTSIKIESPRCKINFRFPIPDMRLPDDNTRIPYWKRNVRNDSVIFDLTNASFSTTLSSNSSILQLDTQCKEARLYYKNTQHEPPILFATALSDIPDVDGPSLRAQGLDYARLLVTLYPEKSGDVVLEHVAPEENEMDSHCFMATTTKGPSPFSARRVIHECQLDSESESKGAESVIPGDRKEMREFADDSCKDVIYKVELCLRYVEIALPSKHFFEELYNRFSSDLLLWEPSAPRLFDETSKQFRGCFAPAQTHNTFSMCKSGIRQESESEDDDEMAAFYSSSKRVHRKRRKISKMNGQSEVAFELSIGKGNLTFYSPFTDTCGNTVPGQKGQIGFKIEQGLLFVVSGYKGDANLGFLCVQSQKVEFYHCDLVKTLCSDIPEFSRELKRTIYPSEVGVLTKGSLDSILTDPLEMLSVAVRIHRDPDKNIKTFKVATGIREGTLDHHIALPNRSWFTHLTDFFDVLDTPIIGYTPALVITELHLHLWNCAVDYRPLNLPLRSILTMESFSISSNIAAQTNTSVIRFIAEDSALLISTKTSSTDLKNDYACVAEMDLFELSLRLCQNRTNTAHVPRVDLTASNNLLHIRTCSDSFKALMDLITYFASYGDLNDPNIPKYDDKVAYSPIKECSSEPALIDTDELSDREFRKMSSSQTEHLHDLVAEAMEDTKQQKDAQSSASVRKRKQSIEMHFTPTEDDAETASCTPLPGDPIFSSVDGLPVDIQPSDDDDEEFCILENDPGVGILPKGGEPEARVLSDDPIRLIENHFAAPVGRIDILRAPKHYPNPVVKYSIHDMSIVWHMYGGSDFGPATSSRNSAKFDEKDSSDTYSQDTWKNDTSAYYDGSEVDLAIDALNPGVMFSKTKAFESTWEAYESPRVPKEQVNSSAIPWRQLGGKGRKHDVLMQLHLHKIKFQHEIYPENAEQSSRFVFVVKDINIIDRLQSSQFNKFLYLYTSSARPKQSHAHMLVVKAVHLRSDPNVEECCLKISVLPIRLNIDQDALIFLYQFFSEVSGKMDTDDEESVFKPPSHTPSVESLPVMTVNLGEGDVNAISEDEDGPNLLNFSDEPISEDNVSVCSKDPSIDSSKSCSPIYFRQVVFSPDVPIRLDYRGKRVDMTHGPLAGLLMGLAQLNCSEIRLKRLSHRNGLLGLDKLSAYMLNEWKTDIKKNQLPSLLGGVGPMHSFVQLFQGVRDLFWLPIEQYQKDGRITKGLQRGANAFSTSTAMAALELTNRFLQTIQSAAEFTYDMVSPGPSVQQQRRQSSTKKRRQQPNDIREGMANAYIVVKEGLGDTVQTIVRVASKEHEQKGMSGAVGGVLRQVPATAVRPVMILTGAASNVIDGLRHQIEPEFKKEAEEKWKDS